MYTLSPIFFLMCSLDSFLLFLPVQKCEIPKCVGPTSENNQKTKKICQCVYATFMCDFLWIFISSLNLPLLKLINDLCLNSFPYNCSTHPSPPHTHTHFSTAHTHTHTLYIHASTFLLSTSQTFFRSVCVCLSPLLSEYLHAPILPPSIHFYRTIYLSISLCVFCLAQIKKS